MNYRDYTIDPDLRPSIIEFFEELRRKSPTTIKSLQQIMNAFASPGGKNLTKPLLWHWYWTLIDEKSIEALPDSVLTLLRLKPIRTSSGVAPITVLTKPYACPGKCIFCPNDIRMPKSYLADEPGAQRAERNWFDPYLQTYNRVLALQRIGHEVDKAEIIVLGGTWSYYPENYQIWFIHECFRALNDFSIGKDDRENVVKKYEVAAQKKKQQGFSSLSNNPITNAEDLDSYKISGKASNQRTYNSVIAQLYTAPEKLLGIDALQTAKWTDLEQQQKTNESSKVRCVGLVIETRPDNIDETEVIRIRRLGCTKAQIGFQSLSDDVLKKNNRGHDVAATRRAVKLLRQAGFKIHAHWMPNLYGSSVRMDIEDFDKMFADPDFRPDELKIYPCSLLESADLMKIYKKGLWRPYTPEELEQVLVYALTHTPRYCRLTRVIRDIPSTYIVDGNKQTNFRERAQSSAENQQLVMSDIRHREVRGSAYSEEELQLKVTEYESAIGTEIFLEFVIRDSDKIAGFLRLSLSHVEAFIDELDGAAVIREVHVYGQLVPLGKKQDGVSQHGGLGTRLIEEAVRVANTHGYSKIAVISSIGTREYYRKRGFTDGQLYQHRVLDQPLSPDDQA